MEELYRRVSDKQTMGSVVAELRVSLGELEKSLDQFFRNPQDKTSLQAVPGQLSQMRGVLSVLGLDQASRAVLRMQDSVEQMLDTEIDEQQSRAAGMFEQLGNSLGRLSFLIDMLNYQPALAKKLFVYDEEKDELTSMMGRSAHASDAASSITVNTTPRRFCLKWRSQRMTQKMTRLMESWAPSLMCFRTPPMSLRRWQNFNPRMMTRMMPLLSLLLKPKH